MRLHYFCGTHWDREWYQPREVFRKHLLDIIERTLDLLDKQSAFPWFVLDGQSIVLEDITEVRPDWRPRLEQAVRQGRLRVGPWYVMPDQFLVSGESLVRNLLYGRQVCESYGGRAWPVGYVCDCFGHAAQLPQLFRGFGLVGAVIWRGLPQAFPAYFRWEAPDGTQLPTLKLHPRGGYGQFAIEVRKFQDRVEKKEFLERVRELVEGDRPYWGEEPVLADAVDHLGPPENVPEMLQWLREAFPAAEVIASDYTECLAVAANSAAVVKGELIQPADCPTNWQIGATISSRCDLKLANDRCANLLELLVEPLLARQALSGDTGDLPMLDYIWKHYLQNHAHDSICGCSQAEIHRQMLARFSEVQDAIRALVDDQLVQDRLRLTGVPMRMERLHPEREVADDGRYLFRIYNPLPYELDEPDEYEVCFPAGTPYICQQGELFQYENYNAFRIYDGQNQEIPYQILGLRRNQRRMFHWDEAREYDVYRLVFQARLCPCGWTTLHIVPATDFIRSYSSQLTSPTGVANEHLNVTIHSDGTFDVMDLRNHHSYLRWNQFSFEPEIGDGWHHVAPLGVASTVDSSRASVRLISDGPVRTTFEITREFVLPTGICYEGTMRESYAGIQNCRESATVTIATTVTLDQGSDRIDLRIVIDNKQAGDFRLQMLFPTDFPGDYFANQCFTVLHRKAGREKGNAIATGPEREHVVKNFAGMIGKQDTAGNGVALLFPAGVHEGGVPARPDHAIVVTLMRTFRRTINTEGENDGEHIGRTEFRASACFLATSPEPSSFLDRQLRLLQSTRPAYLLGEKLVQNSYGDMSFCTISGKLNFCALKPMTNHQGKAFLLRLVNLSPQPQEGSIKVNAHIDEAWLARLDETPQERLIVSHGQEVRLSAGGGQLVSVIFKFK